MKEAWELEEEAEEDKRNKGEWYLCRWGSSAWTGSSGTLLR